MYEQLLHDIRTKRQIHNYQSEALIIFDGFGPHDYDDFLDICTDEGIIVLPLPAHASDQCQPLDLGIFTVQKGKMPRISVDTKLSAQTIQLIRMIDSFTKAASISNVVKAFKIGGIVSHYDIKEKKLFPSVDRTCATRVRHWADTQNECVNKKKMDVSKFRFADDVADGDYEEPICSSQKDRTFTCKRIRKTLQKEQIGVNQIEYQKIKGSNARPNSNMVNFNVNQIMNGSGVWKNGGMGNFNGNSMMNGSSA